MWKLVSMQSTARNVKPGLMKSPVAPLQAPSLPVAAAVSSVRTAVVPTATTRPPRAFVSRTAATVVLAVSGSLPGSLKPADVQPGEALERKPKDQQPADLPGGLAVRLLADPGHETARRFTAYDDFEEMELHATILIDRAGRVHWKRTGGDPFLDMEFLLAELRRMNRPEGPAEKRGTAAADGLR